MASFHQNFSSDGLHYTATVTYKLPGALLWTQNAMRSTRPLQLHSLWLSHSRAYQCILLNRFARQTLRVSYLRHTVLHPHTKVVVAVDSSQADVVFLAMHLFLKLRALLRH